MIGYCGETSPMLRSNGTDRTPGGADGKERRSRLRRLHELPVHGRCRGDPVRAHGAALSGVRERRRAQDERHERTMHGTRMRGGDPALQMRDPEADGDQEEPHDGGSILGMPGLSGPREPGMRTDSATGSRTRRRSSARTVVNGRAPRPWRSDQEGSVRTFRPPPPGRLTAQALPSAGWAGPGPRPQ